MKRLGAMLLTTAFLTACAAPAAPPPAPAPEPPPVPAPPPPPPPSPPPPPDSCGARDLQGLVGRNKSEIPVPVDPSKRRVYCSACAITLDYRPDRVNIVFDGQTGIITEVKCG